MKRRQFIKASAILGFALAKPTSLFSKSGMYASNKSRKVHKILKATGAKVGDLSILRAFAGNHVDYVSPYLLFDEFGPTVIQPNANPLKVEAHPHAGVTPTTYFLEGAGHHKDSLDYDFQINKGDFMLFSSGRGAIHMEETGQKLYDDGGTYHGFQIWLNTPAEHKFIEPTTTLNKNADTPLITGSNYEIKVVLGDLWDIKSSAELLSPAFYYHVKMNAEATLDIPVIGNHNAFIYQINGSIELEDKKLLKQHHLALYERGEENINLYAPEDCEFLILGGQPLNEPIYFHGPFVMNNEEQIRTCIQNYQNGLMGDPEVVNR